VLKHREINQSVSGLSRSLAESMLNQLAQDPRGAIAPSEIPDALAAFDEAMALNMDESAQIVRLGFIYWLRKRRMTLVITTQTAAAGWNPVKITETLAVHTKVIDQLLVADEHAFVAFDQIVEPPAVELIPSGLRACDDSLDGGFGKGEFSLIIAPSGGGKTAFGTQLAASFGLRSHKVLFITTEQPPEELLPRIVSNICRIPFNWVRLGMERSILSSEEWERYEKLRRTLGVNLRFADWRQNRSRSIRADLRAEVERFVAAHGDLDVLIFDWIGRALGAQAGKDQHALRLAYQDTGDALGDLARELGIIVIGFSQAAMGTARGKKRIDQDDIAECKRPGPFRHQCHRHLGVAGRHRGRRPKLRPRAASPRQQGAQIGRGLPPCSPRVRIPTFF
jgi:hypothetical protein